jgi:acetyltransferase-like isoleucine patch superfamily enzyme
MPVKLAALLMLLLPSMLKVFLLRHIFAMQIGEGVRIGFSLVYPETAEIGDRTRIGNFNVIGRMQRLKIGEDVVIGHFNIIMGGREVRLDDGAMIGRFNEINSILNPLVRGKPDPALHLGRRAIVTAWHKIDFTDRVQMGDGVVFAGRLSNIWTHNRQDVSPVSIGASCYVGSGVQMVPGSRIGNECIVGLGAVISKPFDAERVLLAGVPARVIKELDEDLMRLVLFPARPDLDGYGDLTEGWCDEDPASD